MSIVRRIFETLFPLAAAALLIKTGQPWIGFAVLAGYIVVLTVLAELWRRAATVLIDAGREFLASNSGKTPNREGAE